MRGIRRVRPSSESWVSAITEQNSSQRSPYTAIQIEANEKTPLLFGSGRKSIQGDTNDQKALLANSGTSLSSNEEIKSYVCDFRPIGILLFLIGGICIATYLLVTESRLPSMKFSLDLVSHDVWSKTATPLGALLNHSNVVNIMVTHTGRKSCINPDKCLDLLKEMQAQGNNYTEIPFNFLIGNDGLTYEVRGWDHESGFKLIPQTSSMIIGLIGNFTIIAPSEVQMQSALSLFRESIRRKKLQRQYQIYGIRNLTVSHSDGEALFSYIAKWTRFKSLWYIF